MIAFFILAVVAFFADVSAPLVVLSPVDAALQSIEDAGDDLQAFTAAVAYRKDDALLGSKELRVGTIVFDARDQKPTRLAVDFDTRIVNRRRRQESKRIIFDGSWLVECDDASKQFIKRQIVAPGDHADPMRLGGPFPLPIGQKRDEVLKRFTVTLISDAPDSFVVSKNDERSPIGLRLVPHEGTIEALDWTTIELWYDQATWWPIGVVATEINGDARRIRLTGMKAHEQLPEQPASLLSIEEPGEGWSVDVRPWVD
jgi:hypothetical protein